MDTLEALYREIERLRRTVEDLQTRGAGRWIYPTAHLTSVDWDGDSHSTTAKTAIDLSVIFGVPPGVRAIQVRAAVRDEASAATPDLFLLLSPNNTAGAYDVAFTPSGQPNDGWFRDGGKICACNSTGDVFFQCVASGANTLDITLEITGYLL